MRSGSDAVQTVEHLSDFKVQLDSDTDNFYQDPLKIVITMEINIYELTSISRAYCQIKCLPRENITSWPRDHKENYNQFFFFIRH